MGLDQDARLERSYDLGFVDRTPHTFRLSTLNDAQRSHTARGGFERPVPPTASSWAGLREISGVRDPMWHGQLESSRSGWRPHIGVRSSLYRLLQPSRLPPFGCQRRRARTSGRHTYGSTGARSDRGDTLTNMWLFIEGQTDPIPGADKARGYAAGDYWYNLNTGAMVFLTADDEAGSSQKTGQLHVWATIPGGDVPIEVTRPLTGRDWHYVESMSGTRSYEGTLRAAADKLSQVLPREGV